MEKRILLDRFAADSEERLVLAQVLDRMESVSRRQECACSAFLSPKERLDAEAMLRAAQSTPWLSYGGYDEAERRMLLFLPDWMEPEYAAPEEQLALVRCTWFQEDTLTHRDFLGALMGLGLRRDTIGDILVAEASCDLLVLPTVAGFIRDNLTSAGRVRVHNQLLPVDQVHLPQQARKLIHDTVAAMRLDSVASVGFSISRAKAHEAIAQGRVAVNWQDTDKSDLAVHEGDVISCRGLGKCRVAEVGGLSRKGRINITVERYL